MTEVPKLRDWKSKVEEQLESSGHDQKDILKVIHMCQNFLEEIQPINQWLGQQLGYVNQIYTNFRDAYFLRFGEQPPPRPKEIPIVEILLDTTETRKQNIRDVALSITKVGEQVSDKSILEELKKRGMKMDLINPTATISTVLRGFKPQFQKVEGKRGIFLRKE